MSHTFYSALKKFLAVIALIIHELQGDLMRRIASISVRPPL